MTGRERQHRAACDALAWDRAAVACMAGAIIDGSIVRSIERVVPDARRQLEAMGARIVDPWIRRPLPSFEDCDQWQAVLAQALDWSDCRGDEGVAMGDVMRACRRNGWVADFKRVRRLIRKRRNLPDKVSAAA